MLAPALRRRYDLTLGQIGVVLAASLVGSFVSLIPWGLLADRIGERVVIAVGLGACGAALLGSAYAGGYRPLVGLLAVAGFAGAGVNAASGRAVMHWFAPRERGLALGIRQTAIPIGGAVAALALPPIEAAGGVRRGLLALGLACLAGALLASLLREGPRPVEELTARGPFREPRLWHLSGGSALMVVPQMCLVGFTVLFLHETRGVSAGAAAAVLALTQVLGIAARIGAGRWSDLVGSRIVPLRRIAIASAALVALTAALTSAPLAVLVPAMVAAGVVAMSWNGLSFTAAAEIAGHARSGAAIGLQQTALAVSGAVTPLAFSQVVGASSWRLGFGLAALCPLAGRRLLGRVPDAPP